MSRGLWGLASPWALCRLCPQALRPPAAPPLVAAVDGAGRPPGPHEREVPRHPLPAHLALLAGVLFLTLNWCPCRRPCAESRRKSRLMALGTVPQDPQSPLRRPQPGRPPWGGLHGPHPAPRGLPASAPASTRSDHTASPAGRQPRVERRPKPRTRLMRRSATSPALPSPGPWPRLTASQLPR